MGLEYPFHAKSPLERRLTLLMRAGHEYTKNDDQNVTGLLTVPLFPSPGYRNPHRRNAAPTLTLRMPSPCLVRPRRRVLVRPEDRHWGKISPPLHHPLQEREYEEDRLIVFLALV